jgi:hypothetical protein
MSKHYLLVEVEDAREGARNIAQWRWDSMMNSALQNANKEVTFLAVCVYDEQGVAHPVKCSRQRGRV